VTAAASSGPAATFMPMSVCNYGVIQVNSIRTSQKDRVLDFEKLGDWGGYDRHIGGLLVV
jgi:hypothetical protein